MDRDQDFPYRETSHVKNLLSRTQNVENNLRTWVTSKGKQAEKKLGKGRLIYSVSPILSSEPKAESWFTTLEILS